MSAEPRAKKSKKNDGDDELHSIREIFADKIQENRALWDKTCKEYSKKGGKAAILARIEREMGLAEGDGNTHYKFLTDGLRQAKNKYLAKSRSGSGASGPPTWAYWDKMKFLLRTTPVENPTTSNFTDTTLPEDDFQFNPPDTDDYVDEEGKEDGQNKDIDEEDIDGPEENCSSNMDPGHSTMKKLAQQVGKGSPKRPFILSTESRRKRKLKMPSPSKAFTAVANSISNSIENFVQKVGTTEKPTANGAFASYVESALNDLPKNLQLKARKKISETLNELAEKAEEGKIETLIDDSFK